MRHIRLSCAGALAAVVSFFGAVSGCIDAVSRENPFHTFAGGEGRLLLVEKETLLPRADGSLPPPKEQTVRELNLATGVSTVAADKIVAHAADIVANERWVAWIDRANGVVRVLDRRSGAERAVFSKDAAPDPNPAGADGRLRAIDGDWLVGFAKRAGSSFDCYQFVVMNLADGQTLVVENGWQYGTVAVGNGHVVFPDCGPSNAQILGLELRTNIRAAFVETGVASEVISADVRVDGDTDSGVFVRDTVAFWEELTPGSFRSRVISYDLATGVRSTLFATFGDRDTDRDLVAVCDVGAVVLTRPAGALSRPEQAGELALWRFNGKREVLQESTALRRLLPVQVHVVGGLLTWFDHSGTHEFLTYDTKTGKLGRTPAPVLP
ncbi:MAG: hypothetical protein IPM64_05295 [Phycisphaerales bacterium]|nr:hypothetical protein [Phycisphaerales bacterium]